jgi:hypothetical protein
VSSTYHALRSRRVGKARKEVRLATPYISARTLTRGTRTLRVALFADYAVETVAAVITVTKAKEIRRACVAIAPSASIVPLFIGVDTNSGILFSFSSIHSCGCAVATED